MKYIIQNFDSEAKFVFILKSSDLCFWHFPTHPTNCQTHRISAVASVNNYITLTSSTAFITVRAPFHMHTHFLYPIHMIGQTSAVWLTITSQSMKWSVKLTDAITCREQPLQIGCFLFRLPAAHVDASTVGNA